MGSVFITLLLVGAGGYFGLPLLFPNLNDDLTSYLEEEDLEDYTKTEDLTDDGILLQTKYNESQIGATIQSYDLVYEKIPDPELSITTGGNSKLSVAFEGVILQQLGASFVGNTIYNITLDILGVENRTTNIYYTLNSAYGATIEISRNVHISFETDILSAGTYSIALFWKSTISHPAGHSNLYFITGYPRSIYAQEIAG
nr:hypothetical protein DSAG12_03798 [Candidatus Prometheoarchaeum syntrophicum]